MKLLLFNIAIVVCFLGLVLVLRASGVQAQPSAAQGVGQGMDNAKSQGMAPGGLHMADQGKARWEGYRKPDAGRLRELLTPLQFDVTQSEGTERPFDNEYWDNHRDGIYVDVLSGEPLFSSRDKYESGTGWPSFTRPLEAGNIATRMDRSLFSVRTEVRSRIADNHLGHVFDDGPAPTGLRYCMNSAAMRFIPVEDLEKEGYGQYLHLFEKN